MGKYKISTDNKTWSTLWDNVTNPKHYQGNIPFEVVSDATGIPAKRVERIYRNDLPKEDEMVSILEWVGK